MGVRIKVIKGTNFREFHNWPLNREWPLNTGSTVFTASEQSPFLNLQDICRIWAVSNFHYFVTEFHNGIYAVFPWSIDKNSKRYLHVWILWVNVAAIVYTFFPLLKNAIVESYSVNYLLQEIY